MITRFQRFLGTTAAVSVLAVGAFFFGSISTGAATIYFYNYDHGPAETLHLGDVTVSEFHSGDPATVMGSGLGSAGVGPDDEVNGVLHYSAGQTSPDQAQYEGLWLCANGTINSITIVPTFRIISGGVVLPDQLAFGIDLFSVQNNWLLVDPTTPGAITLGNPNPTFGDPSQNVSVGLWANWDHGEFTLFDKYRKQHLSDDLTFEFGFTVISMDYTPVPEPNTAAFLVLGLTGFFFARRKSHS